MNEEYKYVDLPGLQAYDPKIKEWFTNNIPQYEVIEPVYHSDTRILEFVSKPYADSSAV